MKNNRLLKIVLLLVVIITSVLVSCSKNNNGDTIITTTNYSTAILGKWHYTADTIKVYSNNVYSNTNVRNTTMDNEYQQFNADGSQALYVTATDPLGRVSSYTITGTYILSGAVIKLLIPAQAYNPTKTVVTENIKTLNSNSLVLVSDSTYLSGNISTRNVETGYLTK